MKFVIFKASDDSYRKEKEISSIEELIRFQHRVKYDLIIGTTWWEDDEKPSLTIYDDYVE